MSNDSDVVGALMLLFIGAVIYFLPAINARSRKHPNANSILLLDLFLGWTLIGWVAALVWSASAVNKAAPVQSSKAGAPEINRYEALEKLASMKERGHITEDEYQAEKERLFRS